MGSFFIFSSFDFAKSSSWEQRILPLIFSCSARFVQMSMKVSSSFGRYFVRVP